MFFLGITIIYNVIPGGCTIYVAIMVVKDSIVASFVLKHSSGFTLASLLPPTPFLINAILMAKPNSFYNLDQFCPLFLVDDRVGCSSSNLWLLDFLCDMTKPSRML